MKKQYQKHTNIVLNTMFLWVGANYSDIDTQEDNWFFKHTWTEEEEKDFKKWLSSYLYGMKEAQRELCDMNYMKKGDCNRAADMFVLNYGWCRKQPQWYLDKLTA